MQDRTQCSAAESLIGYIYQCRLALLETLKRLKPYPDIIVAIVDTPMRCELKNL